MSIVAGALCVGDIGYSIAETTRSGASVAVGYAKQAASALIAIDNANQLVDNYRDQRDIARRGYNISKQQHDHVKTVFWPRDMQFLNEFSAPEGIETVEVMGRRYGGRLAAAVAGAFAVQLKEAKCSARRYCTSANTKAVSDLMMARSTAIGNARVLGRNIAFAEFQARTDANYERRMQAVARGRGLMQCRRRYNAGRHNWAVEPDVQQLPQRAGREADEPDLRRQQGQGAVRNDAIPCDRRTWCGAGGAGSIRLGACGWYPPWITDRSLTQWQTV